MPLQFICSQRNGQKLADGGFLFIKDKADKVNVGKVMWKCDQHSRLRCKARVHTADDRIVKRIREHCHAGAAGRIEAARVVNKAKELARSGRTEDTEEILAEALLGIAPSVSDQMPSAQALQKAISYAKKHAHDGEETLAHPRTLAQLDVPLSFRTTHAGLPFLLFDSGSRDADRILIYSTSNNLHLLSQSPVWLASGSFKTVPPLFQQLYVIHALVNNNIIPVVYAFLARKDEATFKRFLDALAQLQPNLSPTMIINDFETAYVNAFSIKFPGVQQKGTFYHFCQRLYQKIQATAGLQQRYETDSEFSLRMRMIAALAFMPVSLISNGFEQLMDDNFPPEGQPVLDYVEDTFIGRLDHRLQRRPPPCHPSFWNCYELSLEMGFSRINSAFEKWHCSFGSSISSGKQTLWKFINAVKNEQKSNEEKIQESLSVCAGSSGGEEPKKKRYRYRDSASKMERMVGSFDNRDVLNYLRGIASHFNF